MVDCERARRA